ncbi:MAG: hypothetical protein ABI723_11435 [Bacteroidia bacterium]
MKQEIRQPLSNLQLELLKVFSRKVDDKDLMELKKLIANYFAEKAMDKADEVYEKKKWNKSKVDKLSKTRMRSSIKNEVA